VIKDMSEFEKQIKKLLRISNSLTTKTEKALRAASNNLHDIAYEFVREGVRESERLTLHYRNTPGLTGRPMADLHVKEIIQEEIPVEMGYTDKGWFFLKIPALLPYRDKDKRSNDYIRGFLYPAMNNFFKDNMGDRFEHCVIIYRHVYDESICEQDYRDHNNTEVNIVTDALAIFVMVDDSATRCETYQLSAPGKETCTEVYVVDVHDFIECYQHLKRVPFEPVTIVKNPSFLDEKDVQK